MQDLTGKVDGVSTLPADEWNQLPAESQNVITSTGQTLTDGSVTQLVQAVADYALRGDYYIDSGSANNYVLGTAGTLQGPTAYADGQQFAFLPNVANTGGSTVNILGLGSRSLVKRDGSALPSGTLQPSQLTTIRFDAAQNRFELQGGADSSDNVSNESGVAGASVTNALDTLSSQVSGLGSNDIDNDSSVAGGNVTAALNNLASALPGGSPQAQIFTSNGTYTTPAGAVLLKFTILSAGGGGAGTGSGGGGGGGGAMAIHFQTSPAASYPITVGNGGSSDNNGTSSSAAGISPAPGQGGSGLEGGNGGIDSSPTATTIYFNGQDGSWGVNGQSGDQVGGTGGASPMGGGGRGGSSNASDNGVDGRRGGGGGGGADGASSGGSGGDGMVIVEAFF